MAESRLPEGLLIKILLFVIVIQFIIMLAVFLFPAAIIWWRP
jgi:hypothetical protein